VLTTIETSRAKGLKGKQLEDVIRAARDRFMPLSLTGLAKDYYSHFILRLAYCRSEDLRRWFLQNEVELFKWRFVNNPPEELNAWLARNGLRYEAISREEASELQEKLQEMARCRAAWYKEDAVSSEDRRAYVDRKSASRWCSCALATPPYPHRAVRPYLNPAPAVVNACAPLETAYAAFKSLALRHLLAINDCGDVTGMLTRHDFMIPHLEDCLDRRGEGETAGARLSHDDAS
jgi:hypothetical protein